MKSVRYFTLNFSGFTTAASEKQGYLRLIAGDHVFYTDKRYFNAPSLFDRLKTHQPLYLGARRLDNGSYWIHWLSDGETLLEPSQRVKRWARPLLIISLLTLIVSLIPLLVSASEWAKFGCGIIAVLAFIALLTGLCERLFHPALKRHPAMRDLLAKMAQARRRDFSFCQPLPATPRAVRRSAMPFTHALPERYAVKTDIITDTQFKKWYAGNPTREYHGLGIQCGSLPLAFWWQAGCANFALHPVLYRRQPPFLATGDRIVAVYERDSRAIHALYNASDGAAYVKKPSALSWTQTAVAALLPVLRPRAGDVSAISRGRNHQRPSVRPTRLVAGSGFTGHAVLIVTLLWRDTGGTGADWPNGLVIVTPGG